VQRKDIVIVTPALAEARSGNQQTAQGRSRSLRARHGVRLVAARGGTEDPAERRQGPGRYIQVQAALECPGSAT
jgi:hypothetical protein